MKGEGVKLTLPRKKLLSKCSALLALKYQKQHGMKNMDLYPLQKARVKAWDVSMDKTFLTQQKNLRVML